MAGGIETTEEEFITAGTYARDFMKKYYGNEKNSGGSY